MAAMPTLQLALQFADARHRELLPRHFVARCIRRALAVPAQITVRVVGDDEGLELNRRFRGQDHATNIMTFDYQREPMVVADLVLCAPVVEREARRQRVDLAAHYAHLFVHGALHAQGRDHLGDDEARAMEAEESRVLAVLGFADPYRSAAQRRRR
jgi:probable rRNA maturation factor